MSVAALRLFSILVISAEKVRGSCLFRRNRLAAGVGIHDEFGSYGSTSTALENENELLVLSMGQIYKQLLNFRNHQPRPCIVISSSRSYYV